MSEQVWYLYQNGQQVGPFDKQQLIQLHSTKMIAQDSYLFKVGWKEWRPLEDVTAELGLEASKDTPMKEDVLKQRRLAAPRATISGSVIVHNNGQLTIGKGVNISATGMFVETGDSMFTTGEKLKVTVRCPGLSKPFNVTAEVMRFNNQAPYPTGYGFRFEGLSESVRAEIERVVREQQVKDDAAPVAINFSRG